MLTPIVKPAPRKPHRVTAPGADDFLPPAPRTTGHDCVGRYADCAALRGLRSAMRPGPRTICVQVRVYPREPGAPAPTPRVDEIARSLAAELVGTYFDVANGGQGSAWIIRAAKAKGAQGAPLPYSACRPDRTIRS